MSQTSTGRRIASARWLWLRWSWRDLRARWLQVVAIALVIALGTGSYAGLSSMTQWRRVSTDDAYRQLAMYDLRVSVAESGAVPAGTLLAAVGAVDDPSQIAASEERLIGEIQVDASTAGQAILVPGSLYGIGEGSVNALYADRGRLWTGAEHGEPVGALERNFARHYGLDESGTIRIGGAGEFSYVGHVLTPEYFLVTTERGGLLAEANFAAVFTSLETAQSLLEKPGMVNDLVLTLGPGVSREAVRDEVEAALERELPGIGTTVTTRDDDPSFRLNDKDIEGDQQIYNIFAVLIFAGAAVAAFNLTSRIMDAQRREIGIAMALGVPPLRIAVRPMLVGAEIALLGVALGALVGWALGQAMLTFVRDFQPLPRWQSPFQLRIFAGAAAIGFMLPILATAWPVWRAVSVPPVMAIRPAYRLARGTGFAGLFRRLRLPGGTFTRLPVRNLVRAPRRTLLTALGIAAALAALTAFVGMIDSFLATTERGDREVLRAAPNRVEVMLDTFYPADAPVVRDLLDSPLFDRAEAGARVAAVLHREGQDVEVQLDVIDIDSETWRPTISDGARDRETLGVYISELAADDLGVRPGSMITLRHPRVDAAGQVTFVDTQMTVLGTHPHPFRFIAYIDVNHADIFAPVALANMVTAQPAAGVSADDAKRALFEQDGVSSVQSVSALAQQIRDLLEEFVIVLRVVEGAMLLIALLIAFNSSSISMDERTREHATMFAFGVRLRTVLGMAMLENLILGVFATAAGLGAGWLLLGAIMATRVADTFPDINMTVTLGTSTVAITLVLGILIVCLAPLLDVWRLRSMDVPAKLKVME